MHDCEIANDVARSGWERLLHRCEQAEGRREPQCLSLPKALFITRSVAWFETARLAGMRGHRPDPALAADVTQRIWDRAARIILQTRLSMGQAKACAHLLNLRDALDRAQIDGAACCMMDGLEALIAGDLDEAAVAGAQAWVCDGLSRDLVRWLGQRAGTAPELERIAPIMDLVAWVLQEVSFNWRGSLPDLRELHSAVGRASDYLLFAEPCARLLRDGSGAVFTPDQPQPLGIVSGDQ